MADESPWSDWPPAYEHEKHVVSQSLDWAQSHGLVYRPRPENAADSAPSTSSCITAPVSLYPSPFPGQLFEEAVRLQPLYNALYAHVTVDERFLDRVIGQAVITVDEFQKKLFDIWQTVQREGVKQDLHLGLFRSDYLIHSAATPSIKQVEFNTISSSFGSLASRVSDLHRYLFKAGHFPQHRLLSSLDDLPPNSALTSLSTGLAAAHKAYSVTDSQILMVVQPNERNAFDQRALEWELFDKHGISLLRYTLDELVERTSVDPASSALLVRSRKGTVQISVVYYRAGYTPDDYTSPAIWSLRLLIERSRAIKCPTVALQLAGAKKVQQVLAAPGQLDAFLEKGSTSSTLVPPPKASLDLTDAAHLLNSFTSLYPMDDSPEGEKAYELAMSQPDRFVLKPQREGGGNNVYRSSIPPFLESLDERDAAKRADASSSSSSSASTSTSAGSGARPKEREGYILMELIEPPAEAENVMLKAGESTGVKARVVSELGIYGVCLFKSRGTGTGEGADILINETAGHLLRTKARDSDEGGVAVGFSVIDSPLLY